MIRAACESCIIRAIVLGKLVREVAKPISVYYMSTRYQNYAWLLAP